MVVTGSLARVQTLVHWIGLTQRRAVDAALVVERRLSISIGLGLGDHGACAVEGVVDLIDVIQVHQEVVIGPPRNNPGFFLPCKAKRHLNSVYHHLHA